MNSREELLACPFCGSKPELNILYEEDAIDGVVIRCAKCGISKEKLTVEAAANWWNARNGNAQRPLRDALIGLNDAIDLYWNDGRTDGQIKNIAYWQFKSKEALSAITSTGVEAPAQSPLDRDKVMEVINGRLADYEEIESRNDLTEMGKHAKLAIQSLKRDIEYALTSTDCAK